MARVPERFLLVPPAVIPGIVLAGLEPADGSPEGRVVFEPPVLLPREQFIPLELVRGRQGRGRTPRSPSRS